MPLATGRMTYFSPQPSGTVGRNKRTFQYVKSLKIDCDNDTLLATVKQIGAACHTGNRSCFYTTLAEKEYKETNPLKVFEDVFNVILDRKKTSKEALLTTIFDKGNDKILKKVGEEATEIVIAAKNSDPEEVKIRDLRFPVPYDGINGRKRCYLGRDHRGTGKQIRYTKDVRKQIAFIWDSWIERPAVLFA